MNFSTSGSSGVTAALNFLELAPSSADRALRSPSRQLSSGDTVRDNGKVGTAAVPEFRRISESLDLDLRNRFRKGSRRVERNGKVIVIDPVQHKIVVSGTLAVGRELV